jgi:hypothetical protein
VNELLLSLGGLLLAGVVLGLFVRMRTIGLVLLAFAVLAVAGLLASVALDAGSSTIFTRMGAAGPIIAIIVYVGSRLGAKLRRKTPAESAAAEASKAAARPWGKALRIVGYGVLAVPALFVGNCFYNEVSQPSGLRALCDTATSGRTIQAFMDAAAATAYHRRAGGPAGKNEDEWFDRQYLRVGEHLAGTRNTPGDYSVVFAKPGIGYYACIVMHKDGIIQGAWFEDHGS